VENRTFKPVIEQSENGDIQLAVTQLRSLFADTPANKSLTEIDIGQVSLKICSVT